MLASKSKQSRFESGGPCHWAVTCQKEISYLQRVELHDTKKQQITIRLVIMTLAHLRRGIPPQIYVVITYYILFECFLV